jgi:hypothetical protein
MPELAGPLADDWPLSDAGRDDHRQNQGYEVPPQMDTEPRLNVRIIRCEA